MTNITPASRLDPSYDHPGGPHGWPSLEYTHTGKCYLLVLYNKNSDEQVCWRGFDAICVSLNRSRSTTMRMPTEVTCVNYCISFTIPISVVHQPFYLDFHLNTAYVSRYGFSKMFPPFTQRKNIRCSMLRLFFRIFLGTVIEESFETTQITLLLILQKKRSLFLVFWRNNTSLLLIKQLFYSLSISMKR